MKLSQVKLVPKKKKEVTQIISARVPLKYKLFVVRNKIDPRKLVMVAIDELMKETKKA